ncbi:23S rRNA (adenine(2030)-N(6))-methyltransferase RlmJ [Bordetella avium]|uniref:23S rRNA (adenine(2030)-N(6))-methyltransferase RlmJ n=1 Tax=Bordetella avium TaxID=521 RepID=UPI000E0B7124|nr:23S rRNA (adenine(2030)-N(6))-methyltransferase RlmJ [Bordetella avium]RIQ12784.1 23S rRNA (adenine(2030)-N(6))-methyltransferase RlmJ [Bordetella avium]RIQ19179.1 23S rRNA (adenine(2030)-N(6))-methyltransferase RlmJ [Bordetella avium]RIQ32091.1 23S rRNA (adenine(2030)-N(6))-methyltransferase RlmJ [Bordetella avium]RIQ37958.1 23S rRNA (adenine(2030)-N(6))-methyltransferase RlmJ [Bordetella avium]RIQ41786.1 23S rRNA (adenine(2030)-N(6))-methyltransferase RlmJ [Bordetella avium]
MFSYRHAFHAGNHADVLKHAILVHTLDYMNRKDAPYWVVDTHAGAGLYALDGDWANKNAEYADGVARLWSRNDLPPILADYIRRVQDYNPNGELRHYPGSPWLTLDALRDRDRLRMFEMHPSESEVLVGNLEQRDRLSLRQATVYASDGFEGLKALLPPPTRRGLVLIDPSYEDKQDYRRTLTAVKEGIKRFSTGTYAVWYPLVQRREVADMTRQLERLPVKSWLHASLTVKRPAANGFGLHGSGMLLINPPWTLNAALKEAMPFLARELAQDDRAGFSLQYVENPA